MQYKFEEQKEGEEIKPANERIIEKTGHIIKFSLVEMEHDLVSFDKTLKELKANRDNKKSVADNIEQHHPHVKDIPEFDRYTIHMYQENLAYVKAYDTKIAEIEKDKEEYIQEIAEVKKQLPELSAVPSPYVAPETEVQVEKPVEDDSTNEKTNEQSGTQEGDENKKEE